MHQVILWLQLTQLVSEKGSS